MVCDLGEIVKFIILEVKNKHFYQFFYPIFMELEDFLLTISSIR